MPPEVEDSVGAILNDNPDMDESTANAICNAQNKGDNAALAQALKDAGAEDWIGTVQKLVSQGVDTSVIANVVGKATSGQYEDEPSVRKSLAKSDAIRKVGFEAQVNAAPTIFKAGDEFVIWGPASVEVVDKEGDRIKAKALEDALPQLLKRARLSLEHSDQLVGRILERFETDQSVTVQVGDTTFERSDFPTKVLELDGIEPALYVAGEVYNDSRQARETRKRIEDGELDSYSISGEALVTRKKISDGEAHDDIVDLDLSAVTICEQGMNQKAKFGVVSESDTGIDVTARSESQPEAGSVNDAPSASGRGPSVDAVGTVAAKSLSKTMSQDNDNGEDSGEGFNMEALQKEFKSVLDDALPEGELATKDDMRETAEEVYRQQEEARAEEEEEREAPPEEGEEEEEEMPPEEGMEEKQVPEAVGMLQEKYPNITEEKLRSMLESMGGGGGGGGGEGGQQPPEQSGGSGGGSGGSGGGEAPPEGQQKGNDRAGQEDGQDSGQHDDYEDRPDPEDANDEGVPETRSEKQGGYSAEELEEVLPGDVWEVVREYLDSGEEEEMAGGDMEPEGGDEPSVDIEAADDATIEAAVEKVLNGKGLSKAQGASAPSGDTEKSYDEDADTGGQQAGHGDNPALANFYE